jgi:uncharacterized protein (DUF2062 family)
MTATPPRRSPWPLAVALGLVLVIIVNLVVAVIAVRGADPIVSSYNSEPR